MTGKRYQILVIEDDPDLPTLLKNHFESLDFDVSCAKDGAQGLLLAETGEFDLLIVDYNLPELSGVELVRQLRAREVQVPVLMLTSRSDEIDKVLGLKAGADDYVTKPFGLAELEARIHAVLRRSSLSAAHTDGTENMLRVFGDLKIHLSLRQVTRGSETVELTPLEYSLLEFLSSSPGRPFDRAKILEEVWGTNVMEYEYSLTSVIARLRKKIEETPSKPKLILTLRGFGYRFAREDEL